MDACVCATFGHDLPRCNVFPPIVSPTRLVFVPGVAGQGLQAKAVQRHVSTAEECSRERSVLYGGDHCSDTYDLRRDRQFRDSQTVSLFIREKFLCCIIITDDIGGLLWKQYKVVYIYFSLTYILSCHVHL